MRNSLNDPKLLRRVPLFKSLSDNTLINIMNASENGIEEYGQREIIIREDEAGDCMYIILDGHLEVSIRGGSTNRDIVIATLRPGDFFGEKSLFPTSTGRRNASVKTMHSAKVFRIHKKYALLGIKCGDEFMDETDSEDITTVSIKYRPDAVRDLVMSMPLFKSLNNDELATIRDWSEVVVFGPGKFVIKKFQKSEHLYVILDGHAEVFTLDDDGRIIVLAKLSSGDFFGEQALMPNSNGKCNAFVRAHIQTKLIKIPKEYFRLILVRDKKILAKLKERQENR